MEFKDINKRPSIKRVKGRATPSFNGYRTLVNFPGGSFGTFNLNLKSIGPGTVSHSVGTEELVALLNGLEPEESELDIFLKLN